MNKIIEIDDVKTITEIVNKSFLTVAQAYGYTIESVPNFPAFIKTDVIKKQIADGLRMYVYYENNNFAGCIGFSHCKENTYKIERLAVLPEYRHLGLGKKLLEFIEVKIKENRGQIAEIEIVENNKILKNWYIKLGYKEIKITQYNSLPFKVCTMNKNL